MSNLKRRKSGKKTKKDKTTTEGGATTGDEKTDEEKETQEELNTAESGDEIAEAPAPSDEKTTTSDGEKTDDKGDEQGEGNFVYQPSLISNGLKLGKETKKRSGTLKRLFGGLGEALSGKAKVKVSFFNFPPDTFSQI